MGEATKDLKGFLHQELDRLAEVRDELKVQLQHTMVDARGEWNKLEIKWGRVQEELQNVASHTKEPVHTLSVAARQLLDELKHGYERVRSQLKPTK
jgi:predicted component of type VI protein secretion system